MTHHRAAGSLEHALLTVLNDLSPEEIVTATGKKPAHFYKLALPTNDYCLDMDDAAALDAALLAKGKPARFMPLMQEMVQAALERLGGAKASALNLDHGLRRVTTECGELARAVDVAMADGKLDRGERRTIAREAQDIIDQAKRIRDHVEPPFQTADVVELQRAMGGE